MKKVILALIFVFATGTTFINANSSSNLAVNPSVEMMMEDGKASDCNWAAREVALAISEDHSDRGAGGELMENYNALYAICMQ